MNRTLQLLMIAGVCFGFAWIAKGDDAVSSTAERVPLTRNAMKQALDASKESVPRLPLPPLTAEEKTLIDEQKAEAAAKGEKPRRLGLANNGRMRAYYLPEYGFKNDIDRARSGNSNRDQNSSFDPSFRTKLFWIVSRGNNCTYCLGHQESGLAGRGLSDDDLAALDFDWGRYDAAQQAAFAFATKLSFEPWKIVDADIAALRKHYDESQINQIVSAVAGFNATNRWTGPLRIKQDTTFQFVRPTGEQFASAVTKIGPADEQAISKEFAAPTARPRPALESRESVAAQLDAAKKREPRLKLATVAETQAALSAQAGEAPPQWMRLLVAGPAGTGSTSNSDRVTSYNAVSEKGTLDPRYKAMIAYIGARNDRAWYALGHAMDRLRKLGWSEEAIFALDQPEKLTSAEDREVAQFARKITLDPALMDDGDFERMRKLFNDKQVAEVVYVTTQAAFFDRLTEGAGLQLEK
jgi:alkylhydroperoxidase family enzyme